jgi:hypothetical protein
LVHYTVGDLVDLSILESNRVNFTYQALDNLGRINNRYQPWGGPVNASDSAVAVDRTLDFQVAVKDPLVRRSDDWDFPTNKFPNVGWLGRVHRGTPWQTVYLKSPNILIQSPRVAQNLALWQKWTGNPRMVANFGQIFTNIVPLTSPTNLNVTNLTYDALFTMPTNDWRILDLFSTALNDNSTRGQLSVNQTNLASWSAVLAGVTVLSNSANFAFIEPAGLYDPAKPPPLVRIVEGIVNSRTNFPDRTYHRLGDILATPELTVASPYLSASTNYAGLNDAVVERIPQQILGLLRGGEQPRFVIYSYGQALKPANNSIVASGPYLGLCTNYQVTAEVATRAVVRIEGAPAKPRAIIEDFSILPPD